MSKANALAGLIGSYGDSDEDSDDGSSKTVAGISKNTHSDMVLQVPDASATIHPPPIPHCPWSACYDETSGFTYYWNQHTNAVTWEAPPEYLLALKLAQQQLHTSGSTEVSAEEWQLYQLALAEKQNVQGKVIPKVVPTAKPTKKPEPTTVKDVRVPSKRRISDEDEKIELITSYHNSDSESNDETESPNKAPVPAVKAKTPKVQPKKLKTTKKKEYGPALPPNQNYTMPIGPEIPPEFLKETSPSSNTKPPLVAEQSKKSKTPDNEDSQDENVLLTKLKDKAKLLEKLGGEIPVELQKIIHDEINSKPNSPEVSDANKNKTVNDMNIDDLLQEIEKKELPKVVKKSKIDMFSDDIKSNEDSLHNSPRSNGVATPPRDEIKPLFPSSKNVVDIPTPNIFVSAGNKQDNESEDRPVVIESEKKGVNLYLADASAITDKNTRKKLRISNSVLPIKKPELPSYTTKYAQAFEGSTSERTGLGFSKDDGEPTTPKNAISYGNGLMFTKGETLNEDKKDDDLDDLTELLEGKLKYLNQLQPGVISPVQEMMIQMQSLVSAYRVGALSRAYWRRWARACDAALRRHEAAAAPHGWTCAFQRSEGRYRYEREADGLVQWEYPAATNMDMDICTTPPHPGMENNKGERSPPPLPPAAPLPPLPAVAPAVPPPPPSAPAPAPPPPPSRPHTPPPPAWADPPPPGCDDVAPPLPPEPKQEIGDELTSFYNDIAELEKQAPTSAPDTASNSPEPPLPPEIIPIIEAREKEREKKDRERDRDREKDKEREGRVKKKTKVKISSSIGMKHKSVSSLVAKWQQVAEEINSD